MFQHDIAELFDRLTYHTISNHNPGSSVIVASEIAEIATKNKDTNISLGQTGHPYFNISKVFEDHDMDQAISHVFNVEIALAGFSKSDIEIKQDSVVGQNNRQYKMITVEASSSKTREDYYAYHGIALRDCKRSFLIYESDEIMKASYNDGILTVQVKRNKPDIKESTKISIS